MSHQNQAANFAGAQAAEPVNPNSVQGQVCEMRDHITTLERQVTNLRERLDRVLVSRGPKAEAKPVGELRPSGSSLRDELQDLNARLVKLGTSLADLDNQVDL